MQQQDGRAHTRRWVEVDFLPQLVVQTPLLARIPARLIRMLVVGAALILLAQVAERVVVSGSLAQTSALVSQAQVRAAVASPEQRQLLLQLNTVIKQAADAEKDVAEMRSNQVPWSSLVRRTFDLASPRVSIGSVSLADKAARSLTIEGTAQNQSDVFTFAQGLGCATLFSQVSIHTIGARTAAGGFAQALPSGFPGLRAGSLPRGLLAPMPYAPNADFDYIVAEKTRTSVPGGDQPNLIRGKLIDSSGAVMTGSCFRIYGCCPEWSSQYPKPGDRLSTGSFEFSVAKGTFALGILNVPADQAEVATNLGTQDQGADEHLVWNVVFQKTTPGLPPGPITVVSPTGAAIGTATFNIAAAALAPEVR